MCWIRLKPTACTTQWFAGSMWHKRYIATSMAPYRNPFCQECTTLHCPSVACAQTLCAAQRQLHGTAQLGFMQLLLRTSRPTGRSAGPTGRSKWWTWSSPPVGGGDVFHHVTSCEFQGCWPRKFLKSALSDHSFNSL